MAVKIVPTNNAVVIKDADYPHRWYDAFGAGVIKYIQDFATLASDDTTGDATEWEVTVTEIGAGVSTHVITDLAGGALLFTNAGNDNDGTNMQLGAAAGENVLLNGSYPLYCGIEFAINDPVQSDFWFGVGITDTGLLAGNADGISFRSVDESANTFFVVENTNIEDTIAVGLMVAGSYVTLEFLFDGEDVIAYWNGQEAGRVNKRSISFPDDTELRLSFAFLNGIAAVKTATVKWMRMIHIR